MSTPVIPSFQPRKVQHRRKRQELPEAPPLLVTSVTVSPMVDTQLIVTFSAPIVWDGVTVPTEFRAFTHDGTMDPPFNVVTASGNTIELEFNGGVDHGAAWQVTGPMAGISPAVTSPQDGTVS